jgi:GTP-binding protein
MEKKLSNSQLRNIFDSAKFLKSVFSYQDLPTTSFKEVAFSGRSNVGKSSLINAILNNKKICHTSNTPGRTQSLNFIDIQSKLYLVDLPGYGYAEASKTKIRSWNQLINTYLKERPNLKRVFLLIDSRRSLKENDLEIMEFLDGFGINYQIVLTKIDKISDKAFNSLKESLKLIIDSHPAMHSNILFTSTAKWIGIDEVRSEIAQFI